MRFQVIWGALFLLMAVSIRDASADPFVVDPERGDAVMSAVYDFPPVGERITAKSQNVSCDLDLRANGSAVGACRIPLLSIVVDEEPTRTRHFHDWATHKAQDPAKCFFELKFTDARVDKAVREEAPLPFQATGWFTVCGRARDDGGPEKIEGVVTVLPAGKDSKTKTVRIRARISGFNREQYEIGPEFTPGWLARVPKIGQVVAETGDIEVNLLAFPKGGK